MKKFLFISRCANISRNVKRNIVFNQEISDEQVIEAMYRFQLGNFMNGCRKV